MPTGAMLMTILVTISVSQFIPDSLDWRKHGVVPPVRNQGYIGSSEVYAGVASIESLHTIHTGQLTPLSVTEVVDCCTKLENIYSCVQRLHGLCSQADYLHGGKADTCHSSSCTPAATIAGHKNISKGDEAALQEAVAKTPVLTVIYAGLTSFQLYKGGVYSDPKCTDKQPDHALLIVGYGTENGDDYWICQNSWGPSWGLSGYIRIARNKGNTCGIASWASYPI